MDVTKVVDLRRITDTSPARRTWRRHFRLQRSCDSLRYHSQHDFNSGWPPDLYLRLALLWALARSGDSSSPTTRQHCPTITPGSTRADENASFRSRKATTACSPAHRWIVNDSRWGPKRSPGYPVAPPLQCLLDLYCESTFPIFWPHFRAGDFLSRDATPVQTPLPTLCVIGRTRPTPVQPRPSSWPSPDWMTASPPATGSGCKNPGYPGIRGTASTRRHPTGSLHLRPLGTSHRVLVAAFLHTTGRLRHYYLNVHDVTAALARHLGLQVMYQPPTDCVSLQCFPLGCRAGSIGRQQRLD